MSKGLGRIDPRVFVQNFAMRPELEHDAPETQHPGAEGPPPSPLDPLRFGPAPKPNVAIPEFGQGDPAQEGGGAIPDHGAVDGRPTQPWEMVDTFPTEGASQKINQFNGYASTWDASSSKYKVKIWPGWVLNMDPAVPVAPADFQKYYMPTLGGVSLDADDAPEISVAVGEMVVLRVQTDGRDLVKSGGDPAAPLVTIEAVAEDTVGTHAQPADPFNAAVDGDYYYKLVTFEAESGTPDDFEIVNWHDGGPVIHRPNLWEGRNLPGDAEFYKQRDRDDNVHEFRSPRGRYAINLVETSQTVDFNFDGESVGMGGLDVVSNLIDQFGPAYIRKIRGADSILSDDTQIQVELDSEVAAGEGDEKRALKVRGNGNGTQATPLESIVNGTTVARFVDGLCTSGGNATVAGGNPWAVTPNGDATVDVAAGVIGWWVGTVTGGVTGTPYHHAYQKFTATAGITVTAGGYIVVVYSSTTQERGEETTTNGGKVSMHAYGKAVTSGSVKFSADPSAETDDIVIVIAEVSLDGSDNAVVDHQILTHNPIVEIGELENTA